MSNKPEFSPEQCEVIGDFGQGMAILAGAGSGKTTTLVAKCVRLLEQRPEARFAAVSFTERSASDLRAKLTDGLPKPVGERPGASQDPLARHWVMTIHGLCAAIIGDFPREAGLDGEEVMLSEPESRALWDRAMRTLWEDGLRDEVRVAVDSLLEREGRAGLTDLLYRSRSLASFGALEKLEQSEDPLARALGCSAAYAMDRYARLKRRRGALDFDDLERGADRALEHEAVRRTYHERFSLVLVDEFQDTNPVQARLIQRFARPDFSNLCVVGDPKQSIYRFRDADVGVFEDFCAGLPRNHRLTWNFRSRPGIIEYANGLCAGAFRESNLAFDPLTPRREASPDLEPVVRLEITEPSDFAAWVKSEQARGVSLEKMALLLRRIRGGEKWLRALTGAGIPIAIGSGGLFWEDPRVRECVALLKCWDVPGNSQSGATFLRAPWVGIADETIDGWVASGGTLLESFLVDGAKSGHRLAKLLSPLRARIARPGELIAALLEDDEVERELGAQALGLWHRSEELSHRGLDFHAVVTELGRAVSERRRERDVPPPQGEGARGQLSVLTLHGAKGLEFDHVLLVDFGKKTRAQDMPMLFWDRERGAYLGGRDEEGERDRENPLEADWRKEESRKQLAESKRLFYVAATRARERLVLVCPKLPKLEDKKPAKGPKKEEPDPYSIDYWRGWVDHYGGGIPVVEWASERSGPLRAEAGSQEPSSPRLPFEGGMEPESVRPRRPRHSVTELTLLSRCARAYEWTFVRPRVPRSGDDPEHSPLVPPLASASVSASPDGALTQRELGSRVHACLETGDFDALNRLEAEAGDGRVSADAIRAWAQSSDLMRPGDPASGREVWTELDFEAAAGAEVLVGSIDRLVRWSDPADGRPRFVVIDFKVSKTSKTSLELLEAYQTQIDLYSWAVGRLDPDAAPERVEAALVNLSGQGVQVTGVTPRPETASKLAAQAADIVAGQRALPSPGALCRYCDFRGICPDRA